MNVQFTDKKESIFNQTLLLIKENGFHGTPMSKIAKQSDVAVGTIYHYFPSKEVLIVDLYHYCKGKVHGYIFEKLDVISSYKERFEHVFSRFCAFYIENPIIFSFMDQFYSSPYFELHSCKNSDGFYEQNQMIGFLLEGMESKNLKEHDVHTLAAAYIGAAVAFSKSILYRKIKFEEKNLKELIDIIWQGAKYDNEN